MPNFTEVLKFWFEDHGPAAWFSKNDEFDALIRENFMALYQAAIAGEFWQWRHTPRGRLAEVLVLDQFSRNLFRDDARAFAQDALALILVQEAIAGGFDRQLTAQQRTVLYLPFMHSESLVIHQQALLIYEELGQPDNLDYEKRYYEIIAKFGRYPHRNKVLGRVSTPEEIAFLATPGSSF